MGLNIYESYVKAVNAAYLNGDATEHTHRPALKTLIEAMADKITCTNEPKRLIHCGAPDMKISRRLGHTEQAFGYIECKDIGIDLKKEEKSEQLKRYRAALDTLILTDYVNFRLYRNGQLEATATLAKEGKGGKFVATEDSLKDTQKLFALFLAAEPVYVKNAKELAERMAGMAKLLKMAVEKTFKSEGERGSLHEQYEAFKEVLIHELTEEQFADMYTQTLVYGLFCARCFLNEQAVWGKDMDAIFAGIDDASREFSRQTAARLLPKTNPFLKKIFGHLELELDERIGWLVDDVVTLLKNAQMGHVIKYFGQESKQKDPVVHFYETFLAAYDPKLRESRGVYYTPEPVVSYIVRSVDGLLKDKFGLKQGLADKSKIKYQKLKSKNAEAPSAGCSDTPSRCADSPLAGGELIKEMHRCLILDPAVGTGTFLYEVIKTIRDGFADKGSWPSYVEEHLLPRLFGFELMMAPYTVCHMKLGLLLRMLGYQYEHDKRLEVYLTNTLEEAEEITKSFWSSAISEEARQANRVKRDLPIMVVLGNPPYSGHSANTGDWIKSLVRDYYFVDGQPLGERNPKWLQDDYVKFIRYGQHRIEQTGCGILAFITNHGYLDNPTFRGMRQQLMQTFSEIYILDLHGNTKKKEVCPDGSADKNVFDIQQGVSIGIFVKTPSPLQGESFKSRQDAGGTSANVYHAELWGDRSEKYNWLNKHNTQKTKWKAIIPEKPFYLFNPQDQGLQKEYQAFFNVDKIYKTLLLGPNSHRDAFAVAFSYEEAKHRVDDFFDMTKSDSDIREKYNLRDNRDWQLSKARKNKPQRCTPVKCLYRPFDFRFMLYGNYAYDYHRPEVNDNLSFDNLGLITTRQTKEEFSALATTFPVGQHKLATPYDGSYVAPLYLYPTEKKQDLFDGGDWPAGVDGRVPNLDKGFVEAMAERTGLAFVSDGRGDLGEFKSENPKGKIIESPAAGKKNTLKRELQTGTFGPEDVFAWIYGVFHSPQYRARYAEFLKIDFPRVPLPADAQQFAAVCAVGHELTALHLMESPTLDETDRQPRFPVAGDNTVEAGYPKYEGEKVFINAKQYFEPVRADVWAFMIGGYQVCDKWLKDRRGRTLGYDDIEHYKKISVALAETIRLMADERLQLFEATK